MLIHQPPPIQEDTGPQVVVPAGDYTEDSGNQAEMKQDDDAPPPPPHNLEAAAAAAIFDSSVFVRLGQSLELSSSLSHQQIMDPEIIIHHENVSIISRDDEAKEKDDDNDFHVVDDDVSQLLRSDDDQHLTRNTSHRVQSFLHRFKTAVVGVDIDSTISAVIANTGNNVSSFGRSIGKWGCLFALFAILVSMMVMNHVAILITTTTSSSSPTIMPPPSPREDLQSFVALERDRNDMDKLEDLQTEGFLRYARSACVAAGTLEQAQKALFIQLSGIPEEVRKHTIERALIEGITHRSSMQDSSSKLGTEGKANSYMAFWSTVHHPRGRDRDGFKYETCVLVAGMEIGVTEVIAGYKTEEKKVVVGSTPCECGYFYCAGTCPLFHKIIEKTPIFQRHSLSLKQQDALHRWLVKNAIDAAEGIVLSGGSTNVPKLPSNTKNGGGGGSDKNNENASWEQVEVLGWKKPPLVDAFYLDES